MPGVYFSAVDRRNHNFFKRIRWSLAGLGITAAGSRGYPDHAPDAAVWFVAPYVRDGAPIPTAAARLMQEYRGLLVDYSLDDSLELNHGAYPEALWPRVDLWCRVAYGRTAIYPAWARERLGLLPPFIPRTVRRRYRAIPFGRREMAVLFVGSLTGDTDPDSNARVQAARLLRRSPVRFIGGIYPNVDRPDLLVPEDVRAPRYRRYSHLRRLSRVTFGLALPGNNPLTYRFVECLAMGALCLSPSLDRYDWLAGDIRAGVHYVEIAADLSDLPAKLGYYAAHPAEAESIAAAGQRVFRELLQNDGPALNPELLRRFVGQFPPLAAHRPPGGLPGAFMRAVNAVSGRLEFLKELEYRVKERRLAGL